jgi:hypothetical protein
MPRPETALMMLLPQADAICLAFAASTGVTPASETDLEATVRTLFVCEYFFPKWLDLTSRYFFTCALVFLKPWLCLETC